MSTTPVAFDGLRGRRYAGAGSRPKLEHAYLQLHEPSKDGSLAKPGAELDRIDFQFNPKELTLASRPSWARETGKGNKKSSPPQYKGPQPSKLTLEMFFDASDTQDDSVVKTRRAAVRLLRADRDIACSRRRTRRPGCSSGGAA